MTDNKNNEKNDLVVALLSAHKERKVLTYSDWISLNFDENDVYDIQNMVSECDNRSIGGYKISLTSIRTQRMFNSSSPLFGSEYSQQIFEAPVILSRDSMNEPLIEVELVFIVKNIITSNMSDQEIMQSVTIAGAAELPDSRFSSWWPTLPKGLIIADNAVSGQIVYGPAKTIESAESLSNINTKLLLNGVIVATGNSSEVLGNPIVAVKWLLNKLKEYNKVILPNQIISSGTFFVPPLLNKGRYSVQFDTDLVADFSFNIR